MVALVAAGVLHGPQSCLRTQLKYQLTVKNETFSKFDPMRGHPDESKPATPGVESSDLVSYLVLVYNQIYCRRTTW